MSSSRSGGLRGSRPPRGLRGAEPAVGRGRSIPKTPPRAGETPPPQTPPTAGFPAAPPDSPECRVGVSPPMWTMAWGGGGLGGGSGALTGAAGTELGVGGCPRGNLGVSRGETRGIGVRQERFGVSQGVSRSWGGQIWVSQTGLRAGLEFQGGFWGSPPGVLEGVGGGMWSPRGDLGGPGGSGNPRGGSEVPQKTFLRVPGGFFWGVPGRSLGVLPGLWDFYGGSGEVRVPGQK